MRIKEVVASQSYKTALIGVKPQQAEQRVCVADLKIKI